MKKMEAPKNSLRIMGRTGSALQVIQLANNRKLAKVSLAVNEYFGTAGNQTKHTDWFNLLFWNDHVALAEQLIKKGAAYQVEGRVRVNTYEGKDGVKHASIDVIVNEIEEVKHAPKEE
ncbi:single-stranded DNA-binding protein [Pedobacter yulinensis]|uniref:Single-stranded DNA-binding protein n=1 Tax=Pedobacter yulinensis TaxID=2126353 RepID=A0A2T3HJ19_9SPHI|nr:single-stranded DNA-binding protein [Pedobacter yulinensis]PST82381.1 single-stranded DNA-binding protein [Pedobacter yulinensis]